MSAVKRLAVNGEGFAFDPATGDSFLLNAVGQSLLRGIQQDLGPAELAERISSEFDVELPRASADVDDFLVQLRALRLIEQ